MLNQTVDSSPGFIDFSFSRVSVVIEIKIDLPVLVKNITEKQIEFVVPAG
jgi:hypothetical protein